MVDAGIGERIGRWRRRRGLSQIALAGLVGRSESRLSQVERGLRDVDSLTVLRELARVLRVGLDDLAPVPPPGSHGHRDAVHTSVERAMLAPAPAAPTTIPRVAVVHAAYQDARYEEVLAGLPGLIGCLTASMDPRVLAAGRTVTAKTLTKIGALDLGLLAADRAREAALRSGDRADRGMAVYQVACALLPTTRAAVAEDLAVRTASELSDADDDAARSVVGALWLIAAVAAADRLDIQRFAPALRSRRVQVGLDVAWARTCRRHDADAILALMHVERHAPEVTRHNVYARSTISTLLGRARGSTGDHVRALAARSGVGL